MPALQTAMSKLNASFGPDEIGKFAAANGRSPLAARSRPAC